MDVKEEDEMNKNVAQKVFCLLLMVTAILLAGCSKSGETANAGVASSGNVKNGDIKIGFSIATLTNPIWVDMYQNMQTKAKELGVQLFVNDANNITSAQITGIENFITMGCQVIIIHAFDYEAAIPIVEEAKSKGIKVIAYDVRLPGADAFCGVNNTILGEYLGNMAGEWINKNVGGNGVVGICGVPTIPAILERENGIKAGIMETSPNSKIVSAVAPRTTADAVTEGENFLEAHPDMNCVVSITDAFSLGVFEAFIAAGKSGANIGIFGCDAVPDALNAIALGDIFRGTLFLDAVRVGGIMIETAVKMTKNEPYDLDISMNIQPVTFENVREFMQ
jgi:ribose transport system substrate-binding protein